MADLRTVLYAPSEPQTALPGLAKTIYPNRNAGAISPTFTGASDAPYSALPGVSAWQNLSPNAKMAVGLGGAALVALLAWKLLVK